MHEHMTIGFDKDLRTSDVSAYSLGWCKAYAKAFKEFVDEPVDNRCVHCLPQGDGRMIYNRRETIRRCARSLAFRTLWTASGAASERTVAKSFLSRKSRSPREKLSFCELTLGRGV